MTPVGTAFVQRLEAVERRLQSQTTEPVRTDALTAPDMSSGERWEAGQVWAHLAEFIPYWIGETDRVLSDGAPEPRPFGRTKKDPGRVAAIERERRTDRGALWARVEMDIGSLHRFLGELPDGAWQRRGRHPSLGDMTVEQLVEEFLVGHLEEHAEQLEGLAASGSV